VLDFLIHQPVTITVQMIAQLMRIEQLLSISTHSIQNIRIINFLLLVNNIFYTVQHAHDDYVDDDDIDDDGNDTLCSIMMI